MTVGALRWVSFFYGTAKTAGLKTGSRGEETNLAPPPWGLIRPFTQGHQALGLVPYWHPSGVQGHDENQG